MRQFVGIDLGREPVPDETTVCKFRHLLEEHELGERLFEQVTETGSSPRSRNCMTRVLMSSVVEGELDCAIRGH